MTNTHRAAKQMKLRPCGFQAVSSAARILDCRSFHRFVREGVMFVFESYFIWKLLILRLFEGFLKLDLDALQHVAQ